MSPRAQSMIRFPVQIDDLSGSIDDRPPAASPAAAGRTGQASGAQGGVAGQTSSAGQGGSGGPGDGAADEGQMVTVGPDDSILSIAKANGFFWKTVWNHPRNAALRAKRKDPEILMEGDEVYVPPLAPKQVTKPTEAKHTFKLKGEQAKFKIQLRRFGKPRANEDYILVIDGTVATGKTDADGRIECDIPNDASGGVLKLKGGKEEIPIRIGRLDPADSPNGVRQRLRNLGLPSGEGDAGTMPTDALQAFQAKNQLPVTGEFDGPTKAKLRELHPS